MAQPMEGPRRARLNRDRVLRAAVALADEAGIEALSMRKLAEELGVVPMALYKHVASKEELLDGMVDIVDRRGRPACRRRQLEERDPAADPLGPPIAPAPPLGARGHRVASGSVAGDAGLYRLDDRDVPGRAASPPTSPTMPCTPWEAACTGSPRRYSTTRKASTRRRGRCWSAR